MLRTTPFVYRAALVKRRIAIVTLACAAAVAAAAAAAPDARLGGDFKMRGTIGQSTGFIGQHAGDRVTRIYKFRPQCAAGPCDVTFKRQRGDGKYIKSHMRRKKAGVYKAVDRVRADCFSGNRVIGHHTVTTRTKVTIEEADTQFKATKIRATLVVSAPKTTHCVRGYQKLTLTGKRQ